MCAPVRYTTLPTLAEHVRELALLRPDGPSVPTSILAGHTGWDERGLARARGVGEEEISVKGRVALGLLGCCGRSGSSRVAGSSGSGAIGLSAYVATGARSGWGTHTPNGNPITNGGQVPFPRRGMVSAWVSRGLPRCVAFSSEDEVVCGFRAGPYPVTAVLSGLGAAPQSLRVRMRVSPVRIGSASVSIWGPGEAPGVKCGGRGGR